MSIRRLAKRLRLLDQHEKRELSPCWEDALAYTDELKIRRPDEERVITDYGVAH